MLLLLLLVVMRADISMTVGYVYASGMTLGVIYNHDRHDLGIER